MLLLFQEHLEAVISKNYQSKKYLIIPGLNQSSGIYNFLPNNLFYIFKFPSNEDNRKAFHEVAIKDYSHHLYDHLKNHEYDIIFAHSLGALILTSLLTKRSDLKFNKFKKIFLISPAFGGNILKNIIRYFPDNFRIPSLNRPSWRVHPYCLVKHYKEILELQNDLDLMRLNDIENIEVIYDPRDELINIEKLEIIQKRREYYSVNFPRHLCLDFIERQI